MTTKQVHAALQHIGYSHPGSASSCVKHDIQQEFVSLEGGINKQVIYKGKCESCSDAISCTLEDCLGQQDNAGLDYKDGGFNGVVQCENKYCGGMYLTEVCKGDFNSDSGKFHNQYT